MRVAVTVWENTVSTVCDFSSRLLLVDVKEGRVEQKSFVPFETGAGPESANQLERLGVEVLLCGAISRPLERMIRASGVEVIPSLRGSIDDIVGAYLNGGLADVRFALPGFGPGAGCVRGQQRRRRGLCRWSGRAKADPGQGGTGD